MFACDDLNRISAIEDSGEGSEDQDSAGSGSASIWNTPRADAEAELMAMWLSGEVTAPDSLYDQIKTGLTRLRAQFGGKYPVEDEFLFPSQVSRLSFTAFKQLYHAIKDGEYSGWDQLNEYYEVDSVVLRPPRYGYYGYIYFKGRKNSFRLEREYRRRGEFVGFHADRYMFGAGNLIPWVENGRLAFLVYRTHGHYSPNFGVLYYFKQVADSFQLAGYKDYSGHGQLDLPGWEAVYERPLNRYINYPAFIDSLINGFLN